MASKKLSQSVIISNLESIRAFLSECEIMTDNGNTVVFRAQGVYTFKNGTLKTVIPTSVMSYGMNAYGGMNLSIPVLDDTKHFTEFSTDFCQFNYINGRLVISGKDALKTGKGDYEIELFP